MSKTVIVTLDAIETITKTAEVVVRVPDGISPHEMAELVISPDLANHAGLDWGIDDECLEIHAAKVTEQIEEGGKPDVVIEQIGHRFVPRVNG